MKNKKQRKSKRKYLFIKNGITIFYNNYLGCV